MSNTHEIKETQEPRALIQHIDSVTKHDHPKLNEFQATSICANDILSSVLYVSGLVIPIAGIYAPLVLLFIGLVLLIYKGVYREVVESMPVNGGSYNALLNGTTKNVAATAGVLTILSYIATAVISAKSGVDYLFTIIYPIIHPFANFTSEKNLILLVTALVLGFFALLTINGVKDSAKIAVAIFSFHLVTLSLFVILGGIYLLNNPGANQWAFNVVQTQNLLDNLKNVTGGFNPLIALLFLAYSASLLGVSGFESSANFVEEQRKDVFKKTLRNMLIGVSFFNPIIALLALNINKLPEISQNKDFLLSDQAFIIGGSIFKYILVIDAFLVLCGAVLTAFVGIIGLVKRMTLDECLPQFLNKENKKGSSPLIIITFLLLCVSILMITQGDLASLGGVYAIAFLSVMSMFGISNIILKNTRPELKRDYTFPVLLVLVAIFSTIVGVVGNVIARDGKFGDFSNFIYFIAYFIPLFLVVIGYIYRAVLAKILLKLTFGNELALDFYENVTGSRYAVFIHHPKSLFQVLEYIDQNEAGRNVLLVHCIDKNDKSNWLNLKQILPALQAAGVYTNMRLKLIGLESDFGPEAIKRVSHDYNLLTNRIFVGSVKSYHKFDYDDLGGVRIIL